MLVVHTYCTYFSLIFHPLRLQGPSPSFSTSLSPPSPFSREAVVELNRIRLPSRPQQPSSSIEVVERSHRHPRPMLQSKKLTHFSCIFIKFLLTHLHVTVRSPTSSLGDQMCGSPWLLESRISHTDT